jgi:hypothetical protein
MRFIPDTIHEILSLRSTLILNSQNDQNFQNFVLSSLKHPSNWIGNNFHRLALFGENCYRDLFHTLVKSVAH